MAYFHNYRIFENRSPRVKHQDDAPYKDALHHDALQAPAWTDAGGIRLFWRNADSHHPALQHLLFRQFPHFAGEAPDLPSAAVPPETAVLVKIYDEHRFVFYPLPWCGV